MSQAIVDPNELRRFAANLKKFNAELEAGLTALSGQLHGLSATWRDQEHKKFVEDFEQHIKAIARTMEATCSGRSLSGHCRISGVEGSKFGNPRCTR